MAPLTHTCATCKRQFLVIDKEQSFLNEKGLPFPTNCPGCRQERRLKLRGSRMLFKTQCQKCNKTIIVSYDPAKVRNQILCKEDYEKYFLENDPIITDPLPEV